ncbi:MAG: acetyltransferase [Novosphingobium sp.]
MSPCLDDGGGTTKPDGLHTFRLPHRVTDGGGKEITIRLADCDGERNSANLLIKRKYSAKGYGGGHTVPTDGTCVTFTASSRNALIGTLSLTVDSPAGLACDKTFKEELDKFRAIGGTRICELTRFAFDTTRPSLDLLASLFHIIFIYGTHRYECTDLFIEVNPRHQRFYETMLGFRQVGETRRNDTVGAPSRLMWLKVSDIRRHIDEHTDKRHAPSHSLYPFFFSPREEIGIQMRLLGEAGEYLPAAAWNMLPARTEQYACAQ